MLKKVWLVSLLLMSGAAGTGLANARELVIAFDNTLQNSTSIDAMARSQMLVRNLAIAGVPQAMFLIQTQGINQKDRARLKLYSDKGHLLVNAGHRQNLVNKSDLYAYKISILKANQILKPYPGYKKHVYFSYLHEFGDSHIQRGLADFLQQRGYFPAFIGVNATRGVDEYFNQLYVKKVRSNRSVNMAALESAYVDFISQSLAQEDAKAFNLLGYSPKQILVLQENDLAAYFVVALVDRLLEQGWIMSAAERVLNDPIANPIAANRWGANGYINSVSRLPDERVAYARVLGERKAEIDQFLQARVPGLLD